MPGGTEKKGPVVKTGPISAALCSGSCCQKMPDCRLTHMAGRTQMEAEDTLVGWRLPFVATEAA